VASVCKLGDHKWKFSCLTKPFSYPNLRPGLPDFSRHNLPKRWKNIPNDLKITKWPQNITKGHNVYQHIPFQGPHKYTNIGVFGMKIYNLATLPQTQLTTIQRCYVLLPTSTLPTFKMSTFKQQNCWCWRSTNPNITLA
jgi:hypothetical protein